MGALGLPPCSVLCWDVQPGGCCQLHCLPRRQQLVIGRVDVPVQQGLRPERKWRLADLYCVRRWNLQPGGRSLHQYVTQSGKVGNALVTLTLFELCAFADCLANTFSGDTAYECTSCPSYSTSSAGSTTCTCSSGYYSATGSTTTSACTGLLLCSLLGRERRCSHPARRSAP